MSTTTHSNRNTETNGLTALPYKLDPDGSIARFEVPNFWGLAKVRGRFGQLHGRLDLRDRSHAIVDLRIDAASLDTGNRRRDEHLRSPDFFAVATHPEVSFVASSATMSDDGTQVKLSGELSAAGETVSLTLDAHVVRSADGLELSAETRLDQRRLGMRWSPLGMVRPTSRLSVRARLIADERSAVMAKDRP